MHPFRIHRPRTAAEASEILLNREFSAVYCGGTELLLVMKQGFLQVEDLVDVKGIDSLRGLTVDRENQRLRIGAATTHAELEHHRELARFFPAFREVERRIANVRVRNVGSVGGNLCFNEPHSDVGAFALLAGGRVHLNRAGQARAVPVSSFLTGPYETALERGEIMEALELPLPSERVRIGYERFKVHERPTAVAGVWLETDADGTRVESARVVAACVGPIPVRVEPAEAVLRGCSVHELEEAALEAARRGAKAVEVLPDLNGSERYKRHLTGVLIKRACLRAFQPAEGGEAGHVA